MNCKNCGFRAENGEKYCKNCGTELTSVEDNNYNNSQSNDSNQQTSKQLPKKKKYWLIPVGLFLIGFFSSIATTVFKLLSYNESDVNVYMKGISSLFSILSVISWFLVVPGIIVAIILSVQKNKK